MKKPKSIGLSILATIGCSVIWILLQGGLRSTRQDTMDKQSAGLL
jgi:hypothetical protein